MIEKKTNKFLFLTTERQYWALYPFQTLHWLEVKMSENADRVVSTLFFHKALKILKVCQLTLTSSLFCPFGISSYALEQYPYVLNFEKFIFFNTRVAVFKYEWSNNASFSLIILVGISLFWQTFLIFRLSMILLISLELVFLKLSVE